MVAIMKNNVNDTRITIRINQEMWQEFQAICNDDCKNASQLLRKYIKDYIDNYKQQQQGK